MKEIKLAIYGLRIENKSCKMATAREYINRK